MYGQFNQSDPTAQCNLSEGYPSECSGRFSRHPSLKGEEGPGWRFRPITKPREKHWIKVTLQSGEVTTIILPPKVFRVERGKE